MNSDEIDELIDFVERLVSDFGYGDRGVLVRTQLRETAQALRELKQSQMRLDEANDNIRVLESSLANLQQQGTRKDGPDIEKLAALEHEQWAHWTQYMMNNLTPENLERWSRQIKTPYHELSEDEKESDRSWARKVLAIIKEAESE